MSTREDAWRLQTGRIEVGDLLVWTVCENPKDYPGKFTARPHSTRHGSTPLQFVLVADTLENVRELLPPGLYRMPRDESDDPVIVETWM